MEKLVENIRIKELLDELYKNENHLTASQHDFIFSCKRQYNRNRDLSERQISVLTEIKKYLKTE